MDPQGNDMSLPGLVVAGAGAAVSAASVSVSWWDRTEQLLRMGASVVAILSGLVAIVSGAVWIWFTIKNKRTPKL